MSDAPEIPEVTNPFDKKVALTIAILAVMLSFVENLGDNAKTDAILKTSEASNQWGYYQAKSIKAQIAGMHAGLLHTLGGSTAAEGAAKEVASLKADALRYDQEKSGIKKEAEALTAGATQKSSINDRCDESALMLQIAVVICSVAILSHWRPFWFIGLALGAGGAVVGLMAFLM